MNDHQKKLKIGGHVCLVDRHDRATRELRELVKAGMMKVTKFEGPYSWSNEDFLDPKSTSTYDGCIDVILGADEVVEIRVFEGRLSDGSRTLSRHTFTLEGQWWACNKLTEAVHYQFMCEAESVREDEERRIQKERRLQIADELLRNFDSEKHETE